MKDLQETLINLQKAILAKARSSCYSSETDYNSYYALGYKEACLDAATLLANEFANIDKEPEEPEENQKSDE